MDRCFASTHKILLCKLSRPAPVAVIHGCPIALGDITEEIEPIQVVLGDLACVICLNIISSPKHLVVFGLPWFELSNPRSDLRTLL